MQTYILNELHYNITIISAVIHSIIRAIKFAAV